MRSLRERRPDDKVLSAGYKLPHEKPLRHPRRLSSNSSASAGHDVVPSSPLVPRNDPTLLFTNAGMVQFKNVFTGAEKRPYSRATSVQKCVRAGGKHNDLDNVGYTARHHTFFEMLGNFSFGDYFKEDAIAFAWDFVTKIVGAAQGQASGHRLSRRRRGARAVEEDRGPSRRAHHRPSTTISGRWARSGPCGYCSEIFYDQGDTLRAARPARPTKTATVSSNSGISSSCSSSRSTRRRASTCPSPRSTPAWGSSASPPSCRACTTITTIDLFRHLIAASVEVSGAKAEGEALSSHRVIADHLRATSFLIADGVLPSNEGRGYVLRRIMRRAMRHAHLIGSKDPLMYRLVPTLVAEMGAAYPELKRAEALIAETLKLEETRFRETLARGLKLLDEATGHAEIGRSVGRRCRLQALRHLRLSARPHRKTR